MEVLIKKELELRFEEITERIKEGAVFIHPTDTIYGLSCNALDSKAVAEIHKIKERTDKPFSIWVPSLKWVRDNCAVDAEVEKELSKLPGPYTFILTLKKRKAVADNVTLGKSTIGVRYPDHWFGKVVEKLGFPLVTTSANKSGEQFMTSLEDLDKGVEHHVEFMINEGPKIGKPSKIINLVEGTIKERN